MSASFMPGVFGGLKKAGDAIFKMRAADDSTKATNYIIPHATSALTGWDANGTPANWTIAELFQSYATTDYVNGKISQLIGSAPPATLDTLAELAAQLQNDESAVAALTTQVSSKLSISSFTWSNLPGKPSLGTASSQDSSYFATAAQVASLIIPTNTNQLTNGAGFVTAMQATAAAPVQSVNGQTGNVTLSAGFSGNYNDLTNKPVLGTASAQSVSYFATASQGTKADTALQSVPAQTWTSITGKPAFATVATTGSYNDLSNQPTIPVIPGNATSTTAGLMPASAVIQLANAQNPFIKFTVVTNVLSVGSGAVDGFLVDRAMTLKGYSYNITAAIGTSLSYSLSLAVNGTTVSSSAVSLGLAASSGSVTFSTPMTLTKGDKVELMRNVTAAVAITTFPLSYLNIQATYI